VGPLVILQQQNGEKEDDDDHDDDDDDDDDKEEKTTKQTTKMIHHTTYYRCTYYQDREKRYPFTTNERGYNLLVRLMMTNSELLRINRRMIEKLGGTSTSTRSTTTTIASTVNNNDGSGNVSGNVNVSSSVVGLLEEFADDDNNNNNNNNNDGDNNDDDDATDVIIRIGQGLYAHKPTLRTRGVTWSTEEYSHPGLQRMYLRMKSIQRFTEIWSLLERAKALGVFHDIFAGRNEEEEEGNGGERERLTKENVIRIAAIGGGPGSGGHTPRMLVCFPMK
jgi:hypothetical protein